MPSKSPKQARFMAACAHGAGYSSCPPSKVSTEFNQADKGSKLLSRAMHVAKKYARGGATKQSKDEVNYRHGHGTTKCANCTMFRQPASCTAVAGTIQAQDLCDLFQKKIHKAAGGSIGKQDVILVRHGATKLNATHATSVDRIRGWSDVPLSDVGRKEVAQTAQKLKGSGIQAIVSSDLGRAKETADIIGKAVGVKPVYDKRLRPWDVGEFTGVDTKEALPKLADYVSKTPDKPIPKGESFNHFKERAFKGIKALMDAHKGKKLAIVTHHRVERLLKAWIAKGQPEDHSIDLKTFLQKGEDTGHSEVLDLNKNHFARGGPIKRADGGQVYTVQKGDNLSTIAAKHGMNWHDLADVNGIEIQKKGDKEFALIKPGQELVLPPSGPENAKAAPPPPPPPPPPKPQPQGDTYNRLPVLYEDEANKLKAAGQMPKGAFVLPNPPPPPAPPQIKQAPPPQHPNTDIYGPGVEGQNAPLWQRLHNAIDPVRVLGNTQEPGLADYVSTALTGLGASGAIQPALRATPRIASGDMPVPMRRLMGSMGWMRPEGKWGMLFGQADPSAVGITPEAYTGPMLSRGPGGMIDAPVPPDRITPYDLGPSLLYGGDHQLGNAQSPFYTPKASGGSVDTSKATDKNTTSVPKNAYQTYNKEQGGPDYELAPRGYELARGGLAAGGLPSIPKAKGLPPQSVMVQRAAGIGMARNKAGFLHSASPGRADKLAGNLASGSYVLPADTVSHFGQGNSLAGAALLDRLFKQGPYGAGLARVAAPRAAMPHVGFMTPTRAIYRNAPWGKAEGGVTDSQVPVMLSGGEYVISPESVAKIGGGNPEKGFRILDEFVKNSRKKHIKVLKDLKPPKKD